MKKNCLNKAVLMLILCMLSISCQEKRAERTADKEMNGHGLTHDEIVDSAIFRSVKSANEHVISKIKTVKPSWAAQVFAVDIPGIITYDARNSTGISARISGRIEKMYIKYNYQPIQKGEPIMAIYSPELASTQRELLFLKRNNGSQQMLSKAIQKLRYLGMTEQQINHVMEEEDVQYTVTYYSPVSGYIIEQPKNAPVQSSYTVPSSASEGMGSMSSSEGMSEQIGNDNATVPGFQRNDLSVREGQYVNVGKRVFTIYTNENLLADFSVNSQLASKLKVGQKILLDTKGRPENLMLDKIGLIQPVYNEGQNFASLRVYLKNNDRKTGELLVGSCAIRSEESYWLPEEAVLLLGNRAVVFRKMHYSFQAMPIAVGMKINGMVEIKTDVEGWDVASNAEYLVDSEGFVSLTN